MQLARGCAIPPLRRKQHPAGSSRLMPESCGCRVSGAEARSSTRLRAVLLDTSALAELIRLCPRQLFVALDSWLKLRSRAEDDKEVAGVTWEFHSAVLCWLVQTLEKGVFMTR